MSNTISRFFRSAFTSNAAKPLGGRSISQPRQADAGISRVTATDFSKALPMVNPAAGQPVGWAPVANQLRSTLYRDVIPAPVVRNAQPALPGHIMLVHVRHSSRHLSPGEQAVLTARHALVPVGSQVSITDRRGGRHTYTWAMPTHAYLDGLRGLEAKAAPPPYSRIAAPVRTGALLGIGGLEGPAGLSASLLGLPPARTYLGR